MPARCGKPARSGQHDPGRFPGAFSPGRDSSPGAERMNLTSPDRSALLAILDRFRRQKVVMLGDLVADESIYGEIARVSREAPVLILKQREKKVTPGGGANAVNNLAALGARVIRSEEHTSELQSLRHLV